MPKVKRYKNQKTSATSSAHSNADIEVQNQQQGQQTDAG